MSKIKTGYLTIVLALGVTCLGTPTYYIGTDIGTGSSFPEANSNAANNAFVTAIGAPDSTITFEGVAPGFVSPQTFGIATFTCGGCDPTIAGVQTDDFVPTEDGFNTTSGGVNFYRSASSTGGPSVNTVTLTFSKGVTGFGAYITGVEQFYGTTVVTFNDGAPQSVTLADTGNNTPGGPGGVEFFGFTDSNGINSLTFTTTNNSGIRDLWGIDDVMLSSVPEPAALGLTGAGLAGLLLLRRIKARR